MRPFKSTISLTEARAHLAAAVRPVTRTETLPLANSVGRVAATDLASTVSVPPFARSSMDGYAVIAADTAGATRTNPARLRILERIFSGEMPTREVTAGTCSEIATGAPLPPGADAVVMVEDTTKVDDSQVAASTAVVVGQNTGRRGADIAPGDLVVRKGDLLNPSRVGAIAAIGRNEIEVFVRPRVAILPTGDEVVEPGQQLEGAQIYDVNRFTLSAVIAAHGGLPEPGPPVVDTLEALDAALNSTAGADIVIFSGGSSVGDRDLLVDLVARRGEMIFHGIAVKPGKPTAFARIEGTPLFGMPGNPTSCLSNAYILVVPFLRATARLPVYAPRIVQASLGKRIVSPAGRHQFFTVRLLDGVAFPAFKGSGEITSLSQADGYIEIPATESTIDEGTTVDVTLF
jgi:molybdenum cofactor synthesis domain-containing protein